MHKEWRWRSTRACSRVGAGAALVIISPLAISIEGACKACAQWAVFMSTRDEAPVEEECQFKYSLSESTSGRTPDQPRAGELAGLAWSTTLLIQ